MKRLFCVLLIAALAAGMLTGCKDKEMTDEEYLELIEQKAEDNKKTVALYISGPEKSYEITLDWLVYYLAYYEKQALSTQSENSEYFEALYGEEYDFWSLPSSDGKTTMAETYKSAAYSSMIYTAIMYFEAVEAGVEAGDSRLVKLESTTQSFLAKYTLAERAKCGMSEECIRENYERIFLVDAYAEYLTENREVDEDAIRESIDKEDYRVYQTDYLYISKSQYDDDLNRVELSEEEVKRRAAAAQAAYEKVLMGDDMVKVRAEYDDIMTYSTRDFTRTNISVEQNYIAEAVKLENGEITFLETDLGYYVIKMVDNTQYSGYEDAVQEAIDTAKAQDISEVYEEIEKKYEVTPSDAYESIRLGGYATID